LLLRDAVAAASAGVPRALAPTLLAAVPSVLRRLPLYDDASTSQRNKLCSGICGREYV